MQWRAFRITRPGSACGLELLDTGTGVRAGQEGGIDQIALPQAFQSRQIVGRVLRLPPDRPIGDKAQLAKIGQDRVFMDFPAACGIDILDPDQESPPCGSRHVLADQRRTGMAEMQGAIRAGREAENRRDIGRFGRLAGHFGGSGIRHQVK